jgi:hypothetical protein
MRQIENAQLKIETRLNREPSVFNFQFSIFNFVLPPGGTR